MAFGGGGGNRGGVGAVSFAYDCCEAADAIRVYIQSELGSKHQTWVHVPPELQPDQWKGKYVQPMCRLFKALYGHPQSGAHWEAHLNAAVETIGGVPIPDHNSSFWFPKTKLLLTVYVDDLLLAGPTGRHKEVWDALRDVGKVAIEDPEPLDRFIARSHVFE